MESDLLSAARADLGVSRLSELKDSGVPWGDAVRSLSDSYVGWASLFQGPPTKEPDILRPIIAPVTGFAPFDEVRAAASCLLLSHSVAVSITDTMSYVGRLARLLILLEDMIDAGLVTIIPEPPVSQTFSFSNALLRRDLAAIPPAKVNPAARQAVVESFLERSEVGIALDICAMYPDSVDFACRNSNQVEVLRELIEFTDASMRTKTVSSQGELHFIPEVIQQDFPVFDLSVSDLIQIRKDGLFDIWRSSLKRGLLIAGTLNESDLIDPHSARKHEIREVLTQGADDIKKQVGHSRVLRNSQIGVMSFGASCAAGAIASLGGPVIGAAVGGAAYLATVLLNWVSSRRTSGERSFQRLIFQLFDN